MSAEQKVRTQACALRSDRVTERRRAAEALKLLLQAENVARQIGAPLWKFVFIEIHDYILKELEKYDPNKSTTSATLALCTTLLNTTLINTIKFDTHFDPEKILDCCFEILKTQRFSSAIGNAYIVVLIKYVLPIPRYSEKITPHQWADLLDIIIELSSNNTVDPLSISQILLLILKEGFVRCHLILPVRDKLNLFECLFTSRNNGKKNYLQENYLQIAILVIENIGAESRLAVCRFTEIIIPHVLKYYESTSIVHKNNKKVLMFKFFQLSIILHHPNGKNQKEPGSFANDWESWNHSLLLMYKLAVTESMVINRFYENNESTQLLSVNDEFFSEYIKFSCEICHQIFQGHVPDDEGGESSNSSAKRSKFEYHNFFGFSQTLDNLTQVFQPWINILNNYIKKFGHFISFEDKYKSLMIMFSLSTSDEKSFQHQSLYECIINIYENVKVSEWNQKFYDASVLVWNMALRKTSSQSDIFLSCHKIIQLFLKYSHFCPPLNGLIKSYFDRNMPCSNISIETLIILLKKYNIKINNDSVRLQIAKWVLENYTTLEQKIVSIVLFQLCVKENLPDILEENSKSTEDFVFDNLFGNMENFMLISDFELDILNPEVNINKKKVKNNSHTLYQTVFTFVLEKSLVNLSNANSSIIESNSFAPKILVDVNILLKFMSLTSCYASIEFEKNFNTVMVKAIESLQIISNKTPLYLNDLLDSSKIDTLKSLKLLYENHYHVKEISSLIRENTNKSLIELLLSMGNQKERGNDTDDFSIMETNSETISVSNNEIKFLAIDILSNYCCENAKYRNKSLDYLLESSFYDLKSKSDFNLALYVIDFVLKNFEDDIHLSSLLNLLQNLCKISFHDNEAAFKILSLLYDILKPISICENQNIKNNCIIMLESFLKRCKNHYYSIKTMALALKCSSWILTTSNSPNWGMDLINTLMDCVSSSNFSIRLYSCHCISLYIANVMPAKFTILIDKLQDIFTLYDVSELTNFVMSDEGVNRIVTVLYCLSQISLLSSVWDNTSLATILEIGLKKKIDIKLITKVIKILSNSMNNGDNLITQNIKFLINFWIGKNLPIDKFPYALTGSNSIDDFYYEFRHILVSQEAFLLEDVNDRKVVDSIIQAKNIPRDQIILESLPDLVILCLLDLNYDNFDNDSNLKSVLAQKFKLEIFEVPEDVFIEIMSNNIEKILYGLVTGVHDESSMKNFFLWNKPVPFVTKPTVPVKMFEKVIKYATKCFTFDLSEKIYVENPSILQNLLLQLWGSIQSQYTLERKLLSLYHFWIFSKILDFAFDLNTFICHFVIRSLLATIQDHKNDKKLSFLSVAACRVLFDFLENMLPTSSEIISILIPSIVSTLCQLLQENPLTENFVMKILLKIFCIDAQNFIPLFNIIDPLPNLKLLVGINKEIEKISTVKCDKLETYIDKFIQGSTKYRLEGLKLLYTKLKDHREELIEMFQSLIKTRGFSEDCDDSKLHKLIIFLMKISTTVKDENTCLMASKCLGKIGSCDLQTLVVQAPEDSVIVSKDPKICFIYTCFNEIYNTIFDSNPNVMKAAAKALIGLFSFKDGSAILKNFDVNVNLMVIPFLSKKKSLPSSNFQISTPTFNAYLNRSEIWYDFEYKEHAEWIIDLVVAVLNSFSHQKCFLLDIKDICQLKSSVAEKCFPSLVGLLLSIASAEQVFVINRFIQKYFDRYYEVTFVSNENRNSDAQSSCESIKYFPRASVKCMLQLIQFIRLQMTCYDWDEELLTFNYLPITWAAFTTGSYFSSILYGELWCNSIMQNVPPINSDAILSNENSQNILSIMRKSYRMIGDLDALQGCGLGHLLNLDDKRKHYAFSGHYSDAFLLHDLLLSNQKAAPSTDSNYSNTANEIDSAMNLNSAKSFAQCLHSSGLYYLSDKYMQSFGDTSYFDDVKYDCFWRLGDWNLHVDSSSLISKVNNQANLRNIEISNIWSGYHYMCLKCMLHENKHNNNTVLSHSLNQARLYINSNCELNTAFENSQIASELMGRLQLLEEIENFTATAPENYIDLIECWSVKNLILFNNFRKIESILSQRLVILNNILKDSNDFQVKAATVKLHLEYANLALKSDSIQTCKRWINMASDTVSTLGNLPGVVFETRTSQLFELISLAEGKAAWKSGHTDIAFHLVKTIINKKNIDQSILGSALMTYGSWMVETRRESAQDILNKYLMASLDVLGDNGELSTKLDAYLTIAKFADGEYKQINLYMKSPAFVSKIKCMERCNDTAETLKKQSEGKSLNKNEHKVMIFNQRQKQIDETEISNTKLELSQYLQLALRFYLRSLSEGVENDFPAFRVISLWLDNQLVEIETNEDKSISDYFECIPSWKFLTLLPQLAPRLNHIMKNCFQNTLYELIKRCAIEHPHHTLPILFALKHSNKDLEFQKIEHKDDSEEAYTTTSKKLLRYLLSQCGDELKMIVSEMDQLYLVLISLANHKSKNHSQNQKYKIPRTQSESLKSVRHFSNVLVPTINLPVSKTGSYNNITNIVSFSNEFMFVGGINAPKKLSCTGSDGNKYNILLKGEDDIRQDAVMQQVFGIVNNLLNNDLHTQKSRLTIRTYKVVPLSRQSGLIEWCDGTEPFGRLLIGTDSSGGYHGALRPNDMSAVEARKRMMEKVKATNDEKLKTLKDILSRFKPVFHHFFILNFVTPAVWYERRLAYMRSVATSSMTGYILGLGDRHVQNILIDESTAEVIHIDFGIAFEQGRLQPTPETVPFRLTQNIIAGFGCTGMEGVFTKSCEKTMDVLKSNQEILLTILEVLLYDPLYLWTISEEQAFKQEILTSSLITPSSSTSITHNNGKISFGEGTGSEAERALSRIKNKLEGTEFGSILATTGQVARLLQQATDITNLSRLFHGWQPYL